MVQMIEVAESEHPPFTIEIGRLCAAWSYFEMVTDCILWGILQVQPSIGSIICSHKDIASRWSLILSHGPAAVSDDEMAMFRKINKALTAVANDRNIIVHGLIVIQQDTGLAHARLTRGANAGKRHLVSPDIVKLVMKNIIYLSHAAMKIGIKHGWMAVPPLGEIVNDWAKPIEGFP